MLKQGGSGAVEGAGSEGEDWAKRGVEQDIWKSTISQPK